MTLVEFQALALSQSYGMIAGSIMTHIEPRPSSAMHKPRAWRDKMMTVRIAGEPGHVVRGNMKDSAKFAFVFRRIELLVPTIPSSSVGG